MTSGKTRMTSQRRVILDVLGKVKTHPTAGEVYSLVRRRLPQISLATVYRNLEQLSQAGLVQKLESGCAQRRYDGNADSHYHVRCVECGCVADVDMPGIEVAEAEAGDRSGFEVIGHRVEFIGVCPACRGGCPCGGGAAAREPSGAISSHKVTRKGALARKRRVGKAPRGAGDQ